MPTSAAQDRRFIEAVISSTLLEQAIEWIAGDCDPEEVFSEKELADWAERNGYKKED